MKLFIFHADAGAGHRTAAEAAAQAFLVSAADGDTVEVFDALAFTPAFFRAGYTQGYLFFIRTAPRLWGLFYWLFNLPALSGVVRFGRRMVNRLIARDLVRFVLAEQPDAIICFHFFSAEVLAHLRRTEQYRGKLYCGITDFGLHRFWLNRGIDAYFVACEQTARELFAAGVAPAQVAVTGIPIGGQFSRRREPAAARAGRGLAPDSFTVLVASGGFGVGPLREIVRCLDRSALPLQLIIVCGHNKELARVFQAQKFRCRAAIFGYVTNMDECMAAADLIISKSGGLTVSEALSRSLPMFIIRPIPGQETRNAEILRACGAGARFGAPAALIPAMERAVADNACVLRSMRAQAGALSRPHAAQEICRWIRAQRSL
ncbi:MAG: hypothetical protein NC924_06700 [Candidatus Omnitrophica bacterium]|nr:hypothetical protein [Candidatus Omnitrophota bacterium]